MHVFQVAGHNNCWSSADGNLLDVLVEMEKEREKKEMVQMSYTLPENYDEDYIFSWHVIVNVIFFSFIGTFSS